MLRDYLLSIGEKPFRGDQIMKWIYHAGASDFSEMTDVSKALRERLPDLAEIRAPEVIREQKSRDGTIKWALDVGDGQAVETVYIPEDDRATLCISTQVGCPMGCRFCSTGLQGFNRNLTAAEIVGQVWRAVSSLGFSRRTDERAISNVVMMGMGEPLLNLQNTVTAAEILLDDFGFGLSKRRVTVSTCGIVPNIIRLADEGLPVTLALSLQASNQAERETLLPISKKYEIHDVIDAMKYYFEKTGRRITYEYSCVQGVNTSPGDAKKLAVLLRGQNCHVNLIPVNPVKERDFTQPGRREIEAFRFLLEKYGIHVTIRRELGRDISASCGQLRRSYLEENGNVLSDRCRIKTE